MIQLANPPARGLSSGRSGPRTRRVSACLVAAAVALTALESKLYSLGSGLHTGKLDGAGITQGNSAVSSLGSRSASSGASIKDLATPSLA